MDEVTPIPLDEWGDLFGAMVFLAALAYPESVESRDHFIEAMKANCARYAIPKKKLQRSNAGGMLVMKAQQHRNVVRRGAARITIRLRMAECFAPLYVRATGPAWLKIKTTEPGTSRVLLNMTQMLQALPSDARTAERHWAESKPVLHLAISLRAEISRLASKRGKRPVFNDLLYQPEWVGSALVNAEGHVSLLRTLSPLAGVDFVRLQKC